MQMTLKNLIVLSELMVRALKQHVSNWIFDLYSGLRLKMSFP